MTVVGSRRPGGEIYRETAKIFAESRCRGAEICRLSPLEQLGLESEVAVELVR